MHLKALISTLILAASLPLFSQVVPAATEDGLQQWTIGTGFSVFSPDYGGHSRLAGGTLWINDSINKMPSFLHGISIAIEARDLSLSRSSTNPVIRVDTAGGGAIYKWSRYRNFRPYAEFTVGMGNIDYLTVGAAKFHQTRTVTSMGGGCDIRAFRSVWVRADYEYEYWPNFWITKVGSPYGAPLNPQGVTLGVIYHFGHDRRVY
jgi:hypothetical protein